MSRPAATAPESGASARLGLLLLAACGLVLAYAAWSALQVGGERVAGIVTYFGEVVTTAAALALTGMRGLEETERSARRGWLLLAAAFAGFLVGDGTGAVYVLVLHSQPPFPSVADAGYAFGIAMTLPALLFLGGGTLGTSRLRVVLDGGIVAGALLLLSWMTVLRAVYEAGGDHSIAFALALAYPISDVVLVMVALTLLSQTRQVNPALLMVTLGILAGAFGDSVFAYLSAKGLYRTSYVVETGYFAASLLIATGSRIRTGPRSVANDAELSTWQIVVPYVPVVLACGLFLWYRLIEQPDDNVAEEILELLLCLVLARQFVAVLESRSLTRTLNRTLAALQHTAAEREIVVEEAPVGICRLDDRGRLLAANRTFLGIVGLSMVEVLLQPLVRFLHPDDRDGCLAAYQELGEGRLGRLELESRLRRKDGTITWCSQVAGAVRDASGQTEGFVAIVEDVSERRRQAQRAAQIQRRLLPQAAPQIDGYELAGACLPAQDVAGDLYDWVASDGAIDITVADVMGKGVGAALVMAVVRTALRSSPPTVGPAARVQKAADSVSLGDDGLFVTLFHARLDTGSGRLRYVDAGHGYCAIRRASGELVHLSSRSLPLGVRDDEVYYEGTAELAPGDSLIMYSDGLVERDERTADLSDFAHELDESPDAAESVRRLMNWMHGRATDDVTVVVLRRLPEAAVQAAPSRRLLAASLPP